jgi:hypothetical protein
VGRSGGSASCPVPDRRDLTKHEPTHVEGGQLHLLRIAVVAPAAAAAVLVAGLAAPADAAVRYVTYKNCTALHRVYPHGVGHKKAKDKVARGGRPVTNFYRNDRLYKLNARLDRDHDGVACERH